jgi:hypothetical protein
MKLSEADAKAFFIDFYRGEHHFPGKMKPFGEGWSMSHFGAMATFDCNELTRLVFLAHARCIRVQVGQGGPNRLHIDIWGRQREGSLFERHPTIEQALDEFLLAGTA